MVMVGRHPEDAPHEAGDGATRGAGPGSEAPVTGAAAGDQAATYALLAGCRQHPAGSQAAVAPPGQARAPGSSAPWRPAHLSPGQLERLRRLEQELGVVLVAYQPPVDSLRPGTVR